MKRTDLALEVRESIPEDDKEIQGVILKREQDEDNEIEITRLIIKDQKGAKAMGKPIGTYITMEVKHIDELQGEKEEQFISKLKNDIEELITNVDIEGKFLKEKSVFIVGLGNREVTPDRLGPKVIDEIVTTRHFIREFGEDLKQKYCMNIVTALAPGVMAQTGMETKEIVKGIINEVKPDFIIVIDALAARSVKRLNCTIQLTDTGISPGSGVGNHRNSLNKESLGVPVIAIGVPTVVDAGTIVEDYLEEALKKQGFSENEIYSFVQEINQNSIKNMFVTPNNVDEAVEHMGFLIAEALNDCFVSKE